MTDTLDAQARAIPRYAIHSVEHQKIGGHYGEETYSICDISIEPHADGGWVKWEDVLAGLQAVRDAQAAGQEVCVCKCCDHSEATDCACSCHREVEGDGLTHRELSIDRARRITQLEAKLTEAEAKIALFASLYKGQTEKAEAQRARLREYAGHKAECELMEQGIGYDGWCVCHGERSNKPAPCPEEYECTCGLAALLTDTEEKK